MMRFIFLSMFVLPFCQIVLAEDVLTQNFGQQHLFFSETQVALQYYCNDKPQINWLLESANRKLISGIAKVHDSIATVEFKTPMLNNGVMLKLKLTVDGQTEPFILLSPIIFQSQKETLKKLNVTLIEGENKHLSKVFKQEGIVFNDNLRKIRPSSLIVITDHEITDEMIRLSEANHVIIVPTLPISMSLPQLNDLTTVIMTKDISQVFHNSGNEREEIYKAVLHDVSLGNPALFTMFPGEKLKMIVKSDISSSTGAGWVCMDFRKNSDLNNGRLLFLGIDFFKNWKTSPASQLFLQMIIDEMEIKTKK